MVPLRSHLAVSLLISTVFLTVGRCDDSSPDQVLKRLGVKRSVSSYILAEEAIVKTKLNEARMVRQRLSGAIQQAREIEQLIQFNRQEIRRWNAQRLELNQQLAAAGEGLSVQEHNRLVALINACSDRIRELESQMPDPPTRRQIDADIAERRGAFIQAVLDLRKRVDETSKKYVDLAKDDALKQAMAAREPRSKSPVKFGPSSDFKNSTQQLQNLEKLVLTDTITVVPKGGVYRFR